MNEGLSESYEYNRPIFLHYDDVPTIGRDSNDSEITYDELMRENEKLKNELDRARGELDRARGGDRTRREIVRNFFGSVHKKYTDYVRKKEGLEGDHRKRIAESERRFENELRRERGRLDEA